MKTTSSRFDLEALLDALAERIAARLSRQPSTVAYYTSEDNPLGSKRAFLDAAARGAFPSFKAGRRVLAKREDVHAWIESRERKRTEHDDHDMTDEALLARAGVKLMGKGRR